MDENHQVEAADEIQDALASMMAVEPSPDFAARVRQRIAADAAVRQWSARQFVPALAAAAVVALGVLVIFNGTRRMTREPLVPAATTREVAPAPAVSMPLPELAAAVAGPQEPLPALVPRNEILAIRRLVADAQAGRFEFEFVPAGVPVANELSAPDPILLPPIEMMPIGTSSSFE